MAINFRKLLAERAQRSKSASVFILTPATGRKGSLRKTTLRGFTKFSWRLYRAMMRASALSPEFQRAAEEPSHEADKRAHRNAKLVTSDRWDILLIVVP